MSKIKVIIADDNIDAQEIIGGFMEPLVHFEVIGFVSNGEELLRMNSNLEPHLIIADINMPKLNGIEAIEACVKINPHLKFIFITAYGQYAVKAFDLNAMDYVMKPIKKDRLYVALEKVKLALANEKQLDQKRILTITMDRTAYFIPFQSIIFIEKDNRKTILHALDGKYETNESLDSLFSRLNNYFFRSHRSFIVNIDHISHITTEGETYFAHFRNTSHYAHISKLRLKELLDELPTPNNTR